MHLRAALAEYGAHFKTYRPHRSLNQASLLRALPDPVDADIKVIRRDRLGGLLHERSQVAQAGRVSGTHTLLRVRTIGIGTHVQGNVCR